MPSATQPPNALASSLTPPVAAPPPRRIPFATLAWWAILAYLTVGLACVGIDTALHFTGSPIDGPFQLYNALRRIAAGQRIGVDFQFFHGAGVPYLHYALFRVLGGGFLGSELARQIVSISLFVASFYVVFFAWTRSATSAVRLAIAATLVTILLRFDALYLPINSMIGVRSTMPLLIGAVLATPFRPRSRTVVLGLAVGAALLLATEQGLATIAALILASGFGLFASSNRRALLMRLCASLAIGAATYCLVLLVLGGPSGIMGVIRYNFGAVPKDQFWYFGGPPNRFLSNWRQPLALPMMPLMLTLIGAAVIGSVVRYWRHRQDTDDRGLAELFLGLYAGFSIIPIFGTLVAVYLQPGCRVALILGLLALRRWGVARAQRFEGQEPRVFRAREGLAVTAIALATLYMRGGALMIVVKAPLHVVVAHLIEGDPPTMSADWMTARRTGDSLVRGVRSRIGRTPVIWSTYSGIVESDAGVFNPTFDYIIHALGGSNRRAYTTTFEAIRPDLVQTIRPNYVIYEEWLESNHWEFYRTLLRDYAIVSRTRWYDFWTPRAHPFAETPQIVAEGALGGRQNGIQLTVDGPPDSVTVLEIRVRYHVENPFAKIPFVGGLPRYVIEIAGAANRTAISLAPYETVRSFPVLAHGTTLVNLTFVTKSLLPDARFVVDSVRVTRLQIAPENRSWIDDFLAPRDGPAPG